MTRMDLLMLLLEMLDAARPMESLTLEQAARDVAIAVATVEHIGERAQEARKTQAPVGFAAPNMPAGRA